MHKKIAIYGKNFNVDFTDSAKTLFRELIAKNTEIFVYAPFYKFLKKYGVETGKVKQFTKKSTLAPNIDFLFSVGGDGTFLETIPYIKDSEIPVLGINSGRLGFMANIAADEIKEAIRSIFNNNYELEDRVLLSLETEEKLFGNLNYALNELTVHKKDTSSMISIHTYIDDHFLNTYWADGLIISTPTGSTAYSLSVGGPIVVPKSANFIITPLAPHNLTVRPIVVPDNVVLRLQVEGRSKNFLATLDHRSEIFDSSHILTVRKASFTIKLLKLKDYDFYSTIRNKLLWGVDKRN